MSSNILLKKLYKEMSFKYNLPIAVIDEILKSEFSFVTKTMSSCTFEDKDSFKVVMLPHFGKFGCKPRKLDKLISLYKEGKFNSVVINGKKEKI